MKIEENKMEKQLILAEQYKFQAEQAKVKQSIIKEENSAKK